MKNGKNMFLRFWYQHNNVIIPMLVLITFMVIFVICNRYDHAACIESGGTWNEGMIAGRWSAWCEGGR